jgi:hypothetical protein
VTLNFRTTPLPNLSPGRAGRRERLKDRFPVFGREGRIRSRGGADRPRGGCCGQFFHLLRGSAYASSRVDRSFRVLAEIGHSLFQIRPLNNSGNKWQRLALHSAARWSPTAGGYSGPSAPPKAGAVFLPVVMAFRETLANRPFIRWMVIAN